MTEKQIIERLMFKISTLRRVQDNYFKTGDKHRLKESKGLEADLDSHLKHLRRLGYKEEDGQIITTEQKTFF
jgi:hypothetical protein